MCCRATRRKEWWLVERGSGVRIDWRSHEPVEAGVLEMRDSSQLPLSAQSRLMHRDSGRRHSRL